MRREADDHLSPERLAALIDGAEHAEGRAAAEAHLSRCRACRQALVAAGERSPPLPSVPAISEALRQRLRDLVPAPSPPRSVPLPGRTGGRIPRRARAPLAAAAAVAVAALGWALLDLRRPDREAPASVLRAGQAPWPAPASSAPALVAPVDGAPHDPRAGFRWTEVPEAEEYIVTVLDPRGDIVHRARTAKARIDGLPEALPLLAGGTYYWYVEARRADGDRAGSAIGRFVAE